MARVGRGARARAGGQRGRPPRAPAHPPLRRGQRPARPGSRPAAAARRGSRPRRPRRPRAGPRPRPARLPRRGGTHPASSRPDDLARTLGGGRQRRPARLGPRARRGHQRGAGRDGRLPRRARRRRAVHGRRPPRGDGRRTGGRRRGAAGRARRRPDRARARHPGLAVRDHTRLNPPSSRAARPDAGARHPPGVGAIRPGRSPRSRLGRWVGQRPPWEADGPYAGSPGEERHVTTTPARSGRRLRAVVDPLDEVRSSFLRLAERFRPAAAQGLRAAWVIDVEGRGPTTVAVHDGRCFVAPGEVSPPDARLTTDPTTWLDLVDGRADGVRAYLAGRLRISGDLNLAARFETMFRPAAGASRVLETRETTVKGLRLESMVAGHGATPVLLLHGLAANKVSFLPTFDGLADRYEVHALDLPGFGKSDKPVPAGRRYSMAWMADVVHGYLERNGLRDAHVVGNSMGGRIATELALCHPRAVRSTVGLGAAVAFDEYQRVGPLLRLTRPQYLAAAPLPTVRRAWVEQGIRELFHDPQALPPNNFRAAADDVVVSLRDRGYRLATATCARSLGAERGSGRAGYWSKLAACEVPTYWIFGRHDRLVHPRYAARVRDHLPSAKVDLWDDCGHVPQFEHPDRTNAALTSWIERIEAGR
ncbi:alpha/beta fold hydrolase [Nitriliruptoraceae bacterium ZYF776]|nr:alpha/beta fold hydrolase [Profundirhabdus halotolerans]